MSSFKTLCLIGIASVAMVFSASAQEAGQAVTVTGGDGSVIVMRGGESYSLASGDAIFAGDRIVTRSGGSVSVEVNGCVRDIGASSTIVVNDNFCEAVIASADETILADAPIVEGTSTGSVLPLVGLAVLGGGAAAAAGGGGGGASAPTPSSP
jgi:hypothetical protein